MSSDTDPTSDPGPGVDPIDLETVLRVLDSSGTRLDDGDVTTAATSDSAAMRAAVA